MNSNNMNSHEKSVLVIDDDPDFRELVGMVGESVGTRIVTAPNCSKALEILGAERASIALVLLDYFMPGMNPHRCVQTIRRLTEDRIPLVLVTAAVDASTRARGLGLQRWLSKPFEVQELIDLMGKAQEPWRHPSSL